MNQLLPNKDFKIENIDIIDKVIKTDDNSKMGYIVMVGLKYPDNKGIKEHTKYFSLCPENKPNKNLFSEHMKAITPDNYEPNQKLICDQTNKIAYICHYENLKFYIRIVLKITKVRKIKMTQSAWLKPYIELNTEKRKRSKSNADIDFFKLLSNCFFSKTMENVLKRTLLKFIRNDDEKKILKAQSNLSFDGIHHLNENYSSNMFKNNILSLSKQIYLGSVILDLSKLLMYETYYDKLQKSYGYKKLMLNYVDTHAFVLTIQTKLI